MKISIAMATFNGAEYIREQLDSFSYQTRRPDEVVVFDDNSTDNTLEIIDDFSRSAPFDVQVYRNGTTIGYTKNFENAINQCTGDVIFLSDQDDVWLRTKIETIERVFFESPNVLVTVNDAEITEANLRPTGLYAARQIEALGLGPEGFVTGCCTAINSLMVRLVCPVPEPPFVHDAWLHMLAHYLGVREAVPQVLQYYRRHGDTTSRWLGSSTQPVGRAEVIKAHAPEDPRPWCRKRLIQLDLLEDRLRTKGKDFLRIPDFEERLGDAISAIGRTRQAVTRRLDLLEQSRVRRVSAACRMFLLGEYRHFSGWRSFAKDVLIR